MLQIAGWTDTSTDSNTLTQCFRKMNSQNNKQDMWCPDRCPITFRPFFMWIEHPEKGLVPTYGGPYDSYTIPEPDMPEDGKKTEFHDIEFYCERYDHDEGAWVDGSEDPGRRVIIQDRMVDLDEFNALKARVAELEGLKCRRVGIGLEGYYAGFVIETKFEPKFGVTTLGQAMPGGSK